MKRNKLESCYYLNLEEGIRKETYNAFRGLQSSVQLNLYTKRLNSEKQHLRTLGCYNEDSIKLVLLLFRKVM